MNLAGYSSALLLAAASILPAPLCAQTRQNELLYGTWVLDLARSVFIEREAPESQIMTFAPHADGIEVTVNIINRNGVVEKISYVDNQNGEPAQLNGSRNFDTVLQESYGPYQTVSTFTHAGMTVGHSQRTISLNGQEMIVEVERRGNLSSRAVFVKQP